MITIIDNIKYEWRSKTCRDCSSWMYDLNHETLRYKPDKDYPIHLFHDNIIDNKIIPTRITKSTVEEKINKLILYLKNNDIKTNEAKTYLRYVGIHNNAQQTILNNYNDILLYELPSAWYKSDSLSIFVEVPMHLLFLGVMKSVMLKIGACLRLINQNTNFIKLVSGILGSIKKMNIEWCKILEYPTTDTTGGWVSENFLAMSRLGLWFYSIIEYLPIQEQYIDPITNIDTWTKQQCDRWLHVRGLSKTGNIKILKKQIKDHIASGECPSIKKKNIVSKKDIMDLIYATCMLIKKVMSNTITLKDIEHVEALVRMFLINYDRMDVLINEGPVPSWITKFNMLCLLNLPDILRKYGSIRNLWEGGKDGESYVQTVKSHLKAGLVNEWQTWVITNLYKEKIYDEWNATVDIESNIRKEIRIYGNYKIAGDIFHSGKPISGMVYNNKIYICYRFEGEIKGTRIKLDDKVTLHYGMNYYSISLKECNITLTDYNIDYVGVILLPMLTKDGYPSNDEDVKYCYIRSDW